MTSSEEFFRGSYSFSEIIPIFYLRRLDIILDIVASLWSKVNKSESDTCIYYLK